MNEREQVRNVQTPTTWPRLLVLGMLLWLGVLALRSQVPSVAVYKLDRYLGFVGIAGVVIALLLVAVWVGRRSTSRRSRRSLPAGRRKEADPGP